MTHYSAAASSVRIDRFRESGKWYDTQSLDMSGLWNEETHAAVMRAMTSNNIALSNGWFAIVLEPDNKYAHPICIKAEHYAKFRDEEERNNVHRPASVAQ